MGISISGTQLRWSGSWQGQQSVNAIFDALTHISRFIELTLEMVYIGAEGAESLKDSSTFTKLYLYSNMIER